MNWLVIVILASLAPIWKDPNWEGGKNAWAALHISSGEQKEHIPVDEAIESARSAWADYQERVG